jgi:hypothetical protein
MVPIRTMRRVMCALGLLLAGCTAPTGDEGLGFLRLADEEDPDDALVMWHTIPTQMDCGEERQVVVGMLNYSNHVWEPGPYFLRAWQGPGPFQAPTQVELPHEVPSGETYAFSFPLRAPSSPIPEGANSSWRMYGQGHWFGDIAADDPDEATRVSCPEPEDNANIISTSFPTNVGCNEEFDVDVGYKNTGTSLWTTGAYRLEHADDPFQGPARVELDGNVLPLHTTNFHMTLRAPPGPVEGAVAAWNMVSDQSGPFGSPLRMPINVSCEPLVDAVEISQDIPGSVQCGEHFIVHVRVHNVGTTTWRTTDSGAHGYYLELTPDSVPLGELRYLFPPGVTVEPDESYTFNVSLHSPPNPAGYYIAFRMFNRDRNQPFGNPSGRTFQSTCHEQNSQVVDYSLGQQVVCGQPYPMRIKMLNTGLLPWSREAQYRLKNTTNLPFYPWTPYLYMDSGVVVQPGQSYEFLATLTAPYQPGYHWHGWQMVGWTDVPFGEPLVRYVEVLCEEDAAEPATYNLPDELQCGQAYGASITYKNVGFGVWANQYGHKLGTVGGGNPFGPATIPMPGGPVLPGGSKSFQFNMVGPYTPPGRYPNDWTMLRNSTEFGIPVEHDVELHCSPLDAHLVAVASADVENCEPEVDLFVSVRNTGFKTWGARPGMKPDKFALVQTGEQSQFALTDPVLLPDDVKVPPGKVYTFKVRFRRAPSEPRRVPSWWRMQIERMGGDRLDGLGPELFGQSVRIQVPRVCN